MYVNLCMFYARTNQQALPVHVAGIRNVHKQCPKEVMHFLMELFKYNDNQMNKVGGAQLTTINHD